MKFIKPFIFLILIALAIAVYELRKNEFDIQKEDRPVIEAFFKVLLSKHNFAYTLFGDKPCSLTCYGYHRDMPLDISLQSFDTIVLNKGLKCWQKYSNQFQNSNFLIQHLKEASTLETIAIINKQSLKNTLKKNITLIQTLLNSPISPEELFNKICNEEKFLIKLIKSDILGILLGYGVKNSLAFERRTHLCHWINTLNVFPFRNLCQEMSANNAYLVKYGCPFETVAMEKAEPIEIVKELNLLSNEFETFDLEGSHFCLDQFQSPTFVAYKNDPETKELIAKYTLTREKLIKLYKEKPFLDVTLKQFKKQSV